MVDSCGNDHTGIGVCFFVKAASHASAVETGNHQSSQKGQADLTAVGVAAKGEGELIQRVFTVNSNDRIRAVDEENVFSVRGRNF